MQTADHAPPSDALLRLALVDLVTELGSRRTTPPLLHLGVPGRGHRAFADDPGYDSGLRADVLERALDAMELDPVPLAWVTRDGDLAPGDLDYAWFAATGEAFGRYGLRLPAFFVMTRRGWFDLLSDASPVRRSVRPRRRGSRGTPSPGVHRLVAVHPAPVLQQGLAQRR
jgi:hypothetical protein